jgi:hypothetical protein
MNDHVGRTVLRANVATTKKKQNQRDKRYEFFHVTSPALTSALLDCRQHSMLQCQRSFFRLSTSPHTYRWSPIYKEQSPLWSTPVGEHHLMLTNVSDCLRSKSIIKNYPAMKLQTDVQGRHRVPAHPRRGRPLRPKQRFRARPGSDRRGW